MSIKLLILAVIIALANAKEHIGGRKSIIPRHASERGVLFHIKRPTQGLYKRSKLGSTFDSGVLHKLENFLLKKAEDLDLSSKKSDIENQKEVETIAENDIGKEIKSTNYSEKKKDGGDKNNEKGTGKDKIAAKVEIVADDRKKSIVTTNNVSKKEEINEKKEGDKNKEKKIGEVSKSKEKVKKQEKDSKKEAESKSKNEKLKKKDDITGKNLPKKLSKLNSKEEEGAEEKATKRDKTAPEDPNDDDKEYGR